MFMRARLLIMTLLAGLAPAAFAGIGSGIPGFGDPVFSQADVDGAYAQGRATGRQESSAECIGDPANCGCVDSLNPCGITLSDVLTGAQFGETEPNDHIVAADALIPGVIYWAQTPWIQSILQNSTRAWRQDEDWFYVTTVEPNQLLTLTFTVPDRVLQDTTQLSQGWLISVRDVAGNIYAQIDTRFVLDDPTTLNKNESREITYPIFLGHVGTYYISVEPRIEDNVGDLITDPSLLSGNQLDLLSVMYSPYNIAVVLTFSGLDSAPPDVNFHDVEVEPNDTNATANPIASGVTMFGLLRQVNDGTEIGTLIGADGEETPIFFQTDKDIFKYTAPVPEQFQLAWCGKEACTEDTFWFVEVTDAGGTPLISFNTDKAETVRFGLPAAGDYFIEVNFQRTIAAYCATFSETEFECMQESTVCQVLNVVIPEADPDPVVEESVTAADPLSCSYGPGDTCEAAEESTEEATCLRTDLAQTVDDTATAWPIWRWKTLCNTYGPVCDEYLPYIITDGLNVEYNFTGWGTRLYPLTNGTPAFDNRLELPAFFQNR